MIKSLTIWRNPPILIVQLKRFQFDRQIKRKKIDKVILYILLIIVSNMYNMIYVTSHVKG